MSGDLIGKNVQINAAQGRVALDNSGLVTLSANIQSGQGTSVTGSPRGSSWQTKALQIDSGKNINLQDIKMQVNSLGLNAKDNLYQNNSQLYSKSLDLKADHYQQNKDSYLGATKYSSIQTNSAYLGGTTTAIEDDLRIRSDKITVSGTLKSSRQVDLAAKRIDGYSGKIISEGVKLKADQINFRGQGSIDAGRNAQVSASGNISSTWDKSVGGHLKMESKGYTELTHSRIISNQATIDTGSHLHFTDQNLIANKTDLSASELLQLNRVGIDVDQLNAKGDNNRIYDSQIEGNTLNLQAKKELQLSDTKIKATQINTNSSNNKIYDSQIESNTLNLQAKKELQLSDTKIKATQINTNSSNNKIYDSRIEGNTLNLQAKKELHLSGTKINANKLKTNSYDNKFSGSTISVNQLNTQSHKLKTFDSEILGNVIDIKTDTLNSKKSSFKGGSLNAYVGVLNADETMEMNFKNYVIIKTDTNTKINWNITAGGDIRIYSSGNLVFEAVKKDKFNQPISYSYKNEKTQKWWYFQPKIKAGGDIELQSDGKIYGGYSNYHDSFADENYRSQGAQFDIEAGGNVDIRGKKGLHIAGNHDIDTTYSKIKHVAKGIIWDDYTRIETFLTKTEFDPSTIKAGEKVYIESSQAGIVLEGTQIKSKDFRYYTSNGLSKKTIKSNQYCFKRIFENDELFGFDFDDYEEGYYRSCKKTLREFPVRVEAKNLYLHDPSSNVIVDSTYINPNNVHVIANNVHVDSTHKNFNNFSVDTQGRFSHDRSLDVDNLDVNAKIYNLDSGKSVRAKENITVVTKDTRIDGKLVAQGNTSIKTGELSGNSGKIYGKNVDLEADSIDFTGNGKIQAMNDFSWDTPGNFSAEWDIEVGRDIKSKTGGDVILPGLKKKSDIDEDLFVVEKTRLSVGRDIDMDVKGFISGGVS